jgi:SAM-dependent methyltransferase
MNVYDETDATLYDCYSPGLEGEADFYVQQARETGGPVLELGCGTGRILIPVAEAGLRAVGLDRASAMLAIARRKISRCAADVRERLEIVEGDMRDFSLERQFKLIAIPYRAFLHMLTPEDQRRTLHCIRAHLADDGRFVFNVFDPSLEIIAGHFGPLGPAQKKVSEFAHPETGQRVVVWDTRRYDLARQTIDEYFIFEELDDSGLVISKRYSRLELRWVYRFEMQYLLELCGFRIEALYGDFQRGPFHHGGEQVWIARPA